ncbi:NifU family protein [Flavobacteriaceae bacterium Ap0902]|nr:NifU family protein [Flavobacteriaceae bacterium Ap0902]
MRVYIEQTEQKSILKFVCDEILTPGSFEYDVDSDLSSSKLVQHLFQFPFVRKVFITANFVAVQKSEDVEWEDVAQSIKEIVHEHLENKTILLKKDTKEPYTLYAEMTPNPRVMKFVANQLITGIMVEVKSRGEADKVPLAKALFNHFGFVDEVFLSENYISVTRDQDSDWQFLALEVRQFLLDYLQSGETIVEDDYTPIKSNLEEQLEARTYTSTEQEIQRILDEYIKPAVARDGGNIALLEFNEASKTAVMVLQGACSGCPSSTMTLKNGIETILKDMLPGVVENVEAMNG